MSVGKETKRVVRKCERDIQGALRIQVEAFDQNTTQDPMCRYQANFT